MIVDGDPVMMAYKLPLLLDPQPEGGFTVASPVLPELITEGDSVAEALDNARDALAALIEAFRDLGQPLPPALCSFGDSAPLAAFETSLGSTPT